MMATKKIRLDRRAVTEVLVADTDSESDAEASNDEEFYLWTIYFRRPDFLTTY